MRAFLIGQWGLTWIPPVCDRDLIMSKHSYLSIYHKTAARERVRNNLEALQVIAHCKQHGFIQKQDGREKDNTSSMKSIEVKAKIKGISG